MTVKTRRGAGAGIAAAAASALAVLMGSGSAAWAQAPAQPTGIGTYPAHPFSIQAGLYLPNNGSTRDTLGIDWLSYGASYDFRTTGGHVPQTYSAYVDYFDREKNTGPDTFRRRSEATVVGGGFADRYYFIPKMDQYQPYVGGAVGIYNVHAKRNDPGGYASEYKTSIGAKIFAGAEIREGIFAEVGYHWLPEPKLTGQRIRVGGYQIHLGYRF